MDELVAAAPRPRTTCELQYSDCKLRSPLKGLCLLLSPPYAITAPIDDEANTQIIGTSNPGRSRTKPAVKEVSKIVPPPRVSADGEKREPRRENPRQKRSLSPSWHLSSKAKAVPVPRKRNPRHANQNRKASPAKLAKYVEFLRNFARSCLVAPVLLMREEAITLHLLAWRYN